MSMTPYVPPDRPLTPEELARIAADTRLVEAETRLKRAQAEEQEKRLKTTQIRAEEDELRLQRSRMDLEITALRLQVERARYLESLGSMGIGQSVTIQEISERSADTLHRQLALMERCSEGPVEILVHSPGGSVPAAMRMYADLRRMSDSGRHVTTVVTGMALSAGVIIMQAGDWRLIHSGSMVMMHEVRRGIMEMITPSTAHRAAERLAWIQDRVLDVILARSAIGYATARERIDHDQEWWITAAEAVTLGLADELTGGLVTQSRRRGDDHRS